MPRFLGLPSRRRKPEHQTQPTAATPGGPESHPPAPVFSPSGSTCALPAGGRWPLPLPPRPTHQNTLDLTQRRKPSAPHRPLRNSRVNALRSDRAPCRTNRRRAPAREQDAQNRPRTRPAARTVRYVLLFARGYRPRGTRARPVSNQPSHPQYLQPQARRLCLGVCLGSVSELYRERLMGAIPSKIARSATKCRKELCSIMDVIRRDALDRAEGTLNLA